jgi:hypothetical protein
MSPRARFQLPDWVAYLFAQVIAVLLRRWLG